jgi:hypothetical protein
MSLRHIVLFRFADHATDEQIDALAAGLDALPGKIGQIRSYEHGRDAGLRQGSWDYGLVAVFDTAEDFAAYLDHPDHRGLVRELLDPISAERASVQFAL